VFGFDFVFVRFFILKMDNLILRSTVPVFELAFTDEELL